MRPSLVKIAYVNNSGAVIPPYGIFQLSGACLVTATGDYVFNAVVSGSGNGPYCIDDGGGAAVSGDASYGSCYRAMEGPVWVSYGCTGAPLPWQKVGPIIGQFYVSTLGDGFWYAGQYDSTNGRILVMASTFNQQATFCTGVTSSSASASGSQSSGSSGSSDSGSVSGSGSGSAGCGCITVVTSISCGGGILAVSYGSARGCC